jgi:hypothetical protein
MPLAMLPRSLSLNSAPSRCPPGPAVARSRLSAAHARAPPPSSVMQQHRRPRLIVGATAGRSALPTTVPGPLSAPSPAPTRHRPDPLSFSLAAPRTRAPSKAADHRPHFPSSLFSSPSTQRVVASQLPTKPVRVVPWSPHRLATRSLSHHRCQFSASWVSRSTMHRGSQLACASPSPFNSGIAGPHRRCHPSPERLRHRWTSLRHLRSAPGCRAAARVSHHHHHLVRRIATAPTVLTPPFSRHLVCRSTRTSHANPSK